MQGPGATKGTNKATNENRKQRYPAKAYEPTQQIEYQQGSMRSFFFASAFLHCNSQGVASFQDITRCPSLWGHGFRPLNGSLQNMQPNLLMQDKLKTKSKHTCNTWQTSPLDAPFYDVIPRFLRVELHITLQCKFGQVGVLFVRLPIKVLSVSGTGWCGGGVGQNVWGSCLSSKAWRFFLKLLQQESPNAAVVLPSQ